MREHPGPRRKRRTREHVLADLSANHIEWHALQCGFAVDRVFHDYGLDLAMFTYGPDGAVEPGQVWFQLKATDKLKRRKGTQSITIRVERSDLDGWLEEPMPVILIVYDAGAEVAYWLYVQAQLKPRRATARRRPGNTVTLHIPVANVVDEATMRRFPEFKKAVLAQWEGVVHYD